jgi:hypothetical protein
LGSRISVPSAHANNPVAVLRHVNPQAAVGGVVNQVVSSTSSVVGPLKLGSN